MPCLATLPSLRSTLVNGKEPPCSYPEQQNGSVTIFMIPSVDKANILCFNWAEEDLS